jgi:hypothetical protein
MLFSSAYATVTGIVPPLVTEKSAVISDELIGITSAGLGAWPQAGSGVAWPALIGILL